MKHPIKLLFLAGSFLLFSQVSLAQHFATSAPAGPPPPSGGMIGNASGPVDANFYAPQNAFANDFYYPTGMADDTSFRAAGMSASGASSSAVFGFAQGDANFVPSTYMSFDQALSLGNQMNNPPARPSLGDIARSYRVVSQSHSPEAKGITVTQDNSGKMLVCRNISGACA